MNWVEGLLADSAEIINEEGALPSGYYEHIRLPDDRKCPTKCPTKKLYFSNFHKTGNKSKEIYNSFYKTRGNNGKAEARQET